jgi:pimeloyl-[acyl-carrier protein] methyl ester esterase
MPFFETPSGARLHHLDRGSGRPIVLVHGWSLSSRAFLPLLDPLAREHRVVAPDLRGHGASAPGAFHLSDLAADVAALLDHLDLRGALLVGWSLGAQVALEALPAAGPRVSALALLSGTPRFTQGAGWPHGLPPRSVDGLAAKVRRRGDKALSEFFHGMFAEGELPEDARAALEAEVRGGAPAPCQEALLAGLAVLAEADTRERLGAVSVPTLLVHGAADATCLPAAAEHMARAIPGASLELWPGLGHAPHLSRPAEVAARLVRFARETA